MRRIADRINGDQKAKEGNLSRRADGKLDTVAEGMRKAVGQRCTGVEKDFLERTVLLDGFTYLRRLHLAYRHENRLLSISYNLEWSSEVEADAYFHEVGDCAFALEAKGGLRVKGLEWVCRGAAGLSGPPQQSADPGPGPGAGSPQSGGQPPGRQRDLADPFRHHDRVRHLAPDPARDAGHPHPGCGVPPPGGAGGPPGRRGDQ